MSNHKARQYDGSGQVHRLVRPFWLVACEALEKQIIVLENVRPAGTLGIAVARDPEARLWQKLREEFWVHVTKCHLPVAAKSDSSCAGDAPLPEKACADERASGDGNTS